MVREEDERKEGHQVRMRIARMWKTNGINISRRMYEYWVVLSITCLPFVSDHPTLISSSSMYNVHPPRDQVIVQQPSNGHKTTPKPRRAQKQTHAASHPAGEEHTYDNQTLTSPGSVPQPRCVSSPFASLPPSLYAPTIHQPLRQPEDASDRSGHEVLFRMPGYRWDCYCHEWWTWGYPTLLNFEYRYSFYGIWSWSSLTSSNLLSSIPSLIHTGGF